MNKEELIISEESEKDYREVEELTRDAFWNLYIPGAEEHYLVSELRKSPDFVKELCLVAKDGERIVGNIVYSRSKIETEDGKTHQVVTIGPVSILPTKQSKGIGGTLIRKSIEIAKSLGFKAIVIFGYPSYYKRFGFENGKLFGISAPDGTFPKALQVLELEKDALKGISGKIFESSVFDIDKEKVKEFDKTFPEKEMYVTYSQKAFEIVSNLKYDDPEPSGIEDMTHRIERIKTE